MEVFSMGTTNQAMWTKMQAGNNKEIRMPEQVKCNPIMEETDGDFDFVTRMQQNIRMNCAYHEAAHTVVALATGLGVKEVSIDSEGGSFIPERYLGFGFYPYALPDVGLVRSANVILAAGYLATIILNSLTCNDEWPDSGSLWGCVGEESSNEMLNLVSTQFVLGEHDLNDTKDVDYAVHNAQVIWKTTKFIKNLKHHVAMGGEGMPSNAYPGNPRKRFVLKELISAEKEAEKVLKHHWKAVEKLAESLFRRQSGRMTGKQVRRLIGDVEPQDLRMAS
jgi:hypothetical protein